MAVPSLRWAYLWDVSAVLDLTPLAGRARPQVFIDGKRRRTIRTVVSEASNAIV
jgi:hypothetical protein